MNKTTLPSVNNQLYDQLGHRWYTADDDPVALLRAEAKIKNPWVHEQIKKYLTVPVPKVLDVGCGGGFLSNYLAQKNCAVTGVDLSAASLHVAGHYDATGRVDYQQADALALPFPNGTFDAVTAMDFLEHIDRPEAVIAEIGRVLKPGGVFIFHTFNRNWLANLVVIKFVEWFVPNTPKDMHVYHLFLRPSEVEQFCKNAGLQVKEWNGIRPILWRWKNLMGLWKQAVPQDSQFCFTKSKAVSYLGVAIK